MKMIFKTKEKVDFNHINEFLNIPKDVDIEYSSDMVINYELTPDETNMGLNGIDISIKSVVGGMGWEVYDENLTNEEKAAINSAGGALMNNNYYYGSFFLNVLDTDNDWQIINETEFTNTGSFYFDGIEIDGKKKIITL